MRVSEVSIIYIYVYVGMKGLDENIGPWATPKDKLVQMKAINIGLRKRLGHDE